MNQLPHGHSLEVFLVDDGSTDGTEHSVQKNYPQVNLIRGDGSLYWNGGMRMAFSSAIERDCDYYLWLNDDTLLYSTAIQSLLKTSLELLAEHGETVIVVGSVQDAGDGRLTYGGSIRQRKWKATTFTPVIPRDAPLECETMNGNCVLVPRLVVQAVGNLESRFVHALGDLDYGLRARYEGFSVWLMPGYAGTCTTNAITDTFNDTTLPLTVRLGKMMQPKGLPSSAWRVFTQRHTGILWPIYFLWPYAKVMIKGLVNK